LIQKKYFDTSVIPRIEEALVAAEQQGAYANTKDIGDLAEKLNDTLDQASHDKHLYVGISELPGATPIQPMLSRAERVLDGNVGYLQITAFYRANEGSEVLETAMNFVSHTDALILDFRNNGGGSSDTAVQLLS
jgi:hypothetical protein